jgi:hypothetical protein
VPRRDIRGREDGPAVNGRRSGFPRLEEGREFLGKRSEIGRKGCPVWIARSEVAGRHSRSESDQFRVCFMTMPSLGWPTGDPGRRIHTLHAPGTRDPGEQHLFTQQYTTGPSWSGDSSKILIPTMSATANDLANPDQPV